MKSFLAFVIKEFRHILRDRRTMLILFGMPVIQLLLFGYAIRNEINHAEIAVLDQSRDALSQRLIHKIASSPYFRLQLLLDRSSDIEPAFRSGLVRQVMVITPGFAGKIIREGRADIQIITDASDPNVAQILTAYALSLIQDFSAETSASTPVAIIQPEIKMRYNPEMKSVFFFVPGLIVILLTLICALMTSVAITREKEMGSMEVLLVSPLRPVQIITGKVTPYVMLSLINITSILLIARFVFGVPFNGSYVVFYLLAFLYILTALSLGIFISTISSTQQIAMFISFAGLLLPMIMLSGFVFPVASMPVVLQWLSHIVPAKWFMMIVKGVMLKGVGLMALKREVLILVSMTLAFLLISAKKFKIRLE